MVQGIEFNDSGDVRDWAARAADANSYVQAAYEVISERSGNPELPMDAFMRASGLELLVGNFGRQMRPDLLDGVIEGFAQAATDIKQGLIDVANELDQVKDLEGLGPAAKVEIAEVVHGIDCHIADYDGGYMDVGQAAVALVTGHQKIATMRDLADKPSFADDAHAREDGYEDY